MAGRGTRMKEKFTVPKPLIDIKGKTMIKRAIETLDIKGNYFFLIRKDDHFNALKKELTEINPSSTIIDIDYITEGPAASAMLFKKYINNDEELVIANCDQIMTWNSKVFLINARIYDAALVTYYSNTPKNSYASVDKKGIVLKVVEKKVISNISLNGIHYWKKGKYFVDSCEEMILKNDRVNNEFYVAPTFNYLINKKKTVGIYHIPNEFHNAVGINEDLELYLKKI